VDINNSHLYRPTDPINGRDWYLENYHDYGKKIVILLCIFISFIYENLCLFFFHSLYHYKYLIFRSQSKKGKFILLAKQISPLRMSQIGLFLKLAVYIDIHILVNNSHSRIVFSKLQSVLDEYSRAVFWLQILDVNLI
jgi:hypothetical protein